MNLSKDLIIQALSETDPFVVHDGELYKKFDYVRVEPWYVFETKRSGVFKTESKQILAGTKLTLLLEGREIFSRCFSDLDISQGDALNFCNIGGLIPVNVTTE